MLIQFNSIRKINFQKQNTKENKALCKSCSKMQQTDLNKLRDNRYLINFKGGNALVIDKMQTMVKSKNYTPQELRKLYESLSEIAKQNFNGILGKFKSEGLDFETLLPCAVIANLFYCKPDTVAKIVQDLVKKFEKEGLNTGDYVKACIKQPPLFCLSPKTIEEHIRAYMYVDKNKQGYSNHKIMGEILKKNLAYSTSLIYLQGIILPQLKEQCLEMSKWTTSGIKPKLKEYFEKNPEKNFTIKILNDEMSGNFVKVIKEYCQKDFGRNDMFNIVVIHSIS